MRKSPLIGTFLLLGVSITCQAGWKEASAISAKHTERALIIWERGRLVQERYSNGGSPDRSENIYSITKSLCALSTLSALDRGKLQLDEQIDFPEWKNDPIRRQITVRSLLDQTSGLSPGYDALYTANLKDKEAIALRLKAETNRGTRFVYGPAHYEVLETALSRRLDEPTSEWLRKTLLSPLSISPMAWRKDRSGQPYFSAGAFLTARELLRVGHLIRRQGWHGFFPLISPALLRTALSGSPANPMYGLGFWLNQNVTAPAAIERDVEEAIQSGLSSTQWTNACLSRQAPSDLIAMVGSYGQRVYVAPSRGVVIVRLGKGGGFRDPEFLNAYFR